MLRNIPSSFDDVKKGGWDYDEFMGHQLKGKTIGIIGYGRLGKMMSKYCWVFGMRVIAYDPYIDNINYGEFKLIKNRILKNRDIGRGGNSFIIQNSGATIKTNKLLSKYL